MAVLVRKRARRITSFNTSPEGTVKHESSLHSSNGWTAPQEFPPQVPGMLFYFADTLEPHKRRSVRVPVDEVERTVAIPFDLAVQNSTPMQECLLRVRWVYPRCAWTPNDVASVLVSGAAAGGARGQRFAAHVTFCRHTQCTPLHPAAPSRLRCLRAQAVVSGTVAREV